jgi:hypothetical protein
MRLRAAIFFYQFIYENLIKLKKNYICKYLSNEPICSPAQSRETIPLIQLLLPRIVVKIEVLNSKKIYISALLAHYSKA